MKGHWFCWVLFWLSCEHSHGNTGGIWHMGGAFCLRDSSGTQLPHHLLQDWPYCVWCQDQPHRGGLTFSGGGGHGFLGCARETRCFRGHLQAGLGFPSETSALSSPPSGQGTPQSALALRALLPQEASPQGQPPPLLSSQCRLSGFLSRETVRGRHCDVSDRLLAPSPHPGLSPGPALDTPGQRPSSP